MKPGKYVHIILALCISAALTAVTLVSVQAIYAYDRNNVSHHILTRLQATSGLIELWQHDYLVGVRSIAEDPSLVALVEKLIDQKVNVTDAATTLDQWLRPIYLGRGFDGHSIITSDYKIILSSSPAFTGKSVPNTASREAINNAFTSGVGLGRPVEATYQVRMVDKTADAGLLFQIGCAQIKNKDVVLAVLCLRQDPYRNFFAMLGTGFSGTTGEAYAVDRDGYVVSPTRFGHNVMKGQGPQIGQSTFIKGLQARVPTKNKSGAFFIDNKISPLTKTVALAIEKGECGFIDSYRDYRAIPVVGAVKWIPGINVGIVVEQDVDEVYGPFRFSCYAIVSLAFMAIVLINTLVIVQARGRKSLAEREQRMRTFLDNFPGLAHMRDSKGNFLIANKQIEDFFHVARKEIIGQNHENLPLPQKYINQLILDHDDVLRTGRVIETIKEVADIQLGKVEWLKTIRFPIFDGDTKDVYAVGTIMLDITEQTRNAQELEAIRVNLEKMVETRTAQFEAAKLEAEQAARAKSDFLANMSHEIRTPMNAIIGLSHLATLVSDDPKLRSYLQRIHQSSSHLLSIINDILDFSKIEAGKMTIEPVDFSLEDMLDNVIGLLWEKADDKGLELLLEIDTDIPDNLNGDALRIGQVLINFTGNAVKFTETGDVVLRVRKLYENAQSVRVRFEVQDTGIGIPAERFNQLFKPFHQLDTSSTRRFEGTGLGLTISKNLVELMNGKLEISSESGVGSIFSLELTLEKSSVQDLVSYRKISLQECRMLVVDDNQHARDILSHMLRALAIEVTEASSGLAALDIINAQNAMGKTFDIIFLDWKMPGISGIETAEYISKLNLIAQPKLVLASAHSNHEIGSNIENLLGAILSKPVTPSALYDTVIGLLKNSNIKNEHNLTLDINLYKNLAGTRVLLVDDNDINQDVVKELLALVGANIIVAGNGQQALQCLTQTQFDVVLMDVQMPVMDGIEATRQIRVQKQHSILPIIAMTANARSDDREKCLNAGMNDYVSKPINPEILFRTLLRWHNNSAQHLQNSQPTVTPDRQQNPILSNLYKIKNLEVDAALERLLNNKTFYLKLIERFANERSNTVEVIETALKENNLEEAIRQAHTFKSLAGTVGAVELQEIALQIEMGLHEKNDVSDLLINLRLKLQEFVSALYAILAIRQ